MKIILRTDVGKVRRINEDAAYAKGPLFIVCDGMGGHQAGDVASRLAVDTLTGDLVGREPSVRTLQEAIAHANEKVWAKAKSDGTCRGMGTTMTLLWMDEDQAFIAQIGDSRAYLFRGGLLRQCTHDHSMVAELVRSGAITKEEAKAHPGRNLVTRALGTDSKVEADIFEVGRRKGDLWLLCSDGLTSHVSDEEITEALSLWDGEKAGDDLLALALARGGTDNITLCLLLDEGGDGR